MQGPRSVKSQIALSAKTLAQLGFTKIENSQLSIHGLACESHAVGKGYLFAALSGVNTHGAKYAQQALSRGASAILTDNEGAGFINKMIGNQNVEIIVDESPRSKLSLVAASFYEHSPDVIVAVTGTNGKTSVASMCRQIWQHLGLESANIGTTGIEGAFSAQLSLTTPDPITLHRMLSMMAHSSISHVAMEASSHGLRQSRLNGLNIASAAFTNISHDHLDYHQNLDDYLNAKLILFDRILSIEGTAVICTDDPYAEIVLNHSRARNLNTITVGRNSCDLKIIGQRFTSTGQQLRFSWKGKVFERNLNLLGDFQALNLLTAAGLVIATGSEFEAVFSTFESIKTVSGRLELVSVRDNNSSIYVDYAHTPASLQSALIALRKHIQGRLLIVFGAGGNRDRQKREIMGEMARKHADLVYITDDNPRHEEPDRIRNEILKGCPDAIVIGDRAKAILVAASELQAGDALIIAGKGHETGQIIGDNVIHFNDSEQASIAARLLDGKRV